MEQLPEQSYPEFVASRFKNPDATAADLAKATPYVAAYSHAAIGLVGELLELAECQTGEHFKEELGDCWFFYTALLNIYGLVHEGKSAGCTSVNQARHIVVSCANELMDIAKKALIYLKPMPTHELMVAKLQHLGTHLHDYMNLVGHSPASLQESNVAKLTKRYATGYSNAAAQERADKPAGE